MAPSLEEPTAYAGEINNFTKLSLKSSPSAKVASYVPGGSIVENHDEVYEFEDLKPYFPNVQWPALEEVAYTDKGLDGSPTFENLKAIATSIQDYNPKIGTEISGVDLADLTDPQKNDIARLIATRGVVFFRDQKNLTIEKQRELGSYFGKLHKHATTSVPKRGDLDDVHVIWADEKSKDQRAKFTPTFLWHSDVSYHLLSHHYHKY
jgi:sulfonate dioxygenase